MAGKFILYEHRNKLNGKRYIGITSNKTKRWYGKGKHYEGSPYFWAAIQKYGWDNFEHNILIFDLSLSEANALEIHYIKKYKTNDKSFGYNLESGGNNAPTMLGKHHSAETRAKMRESALGRKQTKEQKERHSAFMMGLLVGARNGKSRAVRCINTGKVYETQRAAADDTGASQAKICLCCQGKRNHTHGLKWEYYTEG